MAGLTANFKFRKDSSDDFYSIDVVNDNLDKIDSALKNIDTEAKNKDGGNADTVDGKHADDFAPSGYGWGTDIPILNDETDCNDLCKSGFYFGKNLINSPKNDDGLNSVAYRIISGDAWYIITLAYNISNVTQMAFCANVDFFKGIMYIRRQMTFKWSKWQQVRGNSITLDGKSLSEIQNYNNLTNKPESLPANGGNADTIDGKHASDLQNYNNLTNKPVSLKNPNSLNIQFNGTSNMSYDGSASKTVNISLSNIGAAASNHTHTKSQITNFPTSLPAKGGTAETISTVLPISKGGTGASTVINALKNLGMVDSNFNMTANKPGGSVLIYSGLNAIGITEPKTMREIFNVMSYNTSLCFRTVKSQSACVTDVPLEYAQILCVKGSTENYRYAIAFGCDNDNHDIYYYAEESDGVKINWRKINDGGNADTVDNKHASDFAPSGYGIGTVCAYIPNNDCNDIDSTGFYMGSELTNAPNNDNGTNSVAYDYGNNWWYIINLKHRDTYKRQIAFVLQAFNSSKHNSSIFTRICDGVWSKWSRVGGNDYTSTRNFTAAAGNWYRVIGNKGKACGGTFTLTAGISSYSSTTVFAAAQQYTATSNKESKITKLAHSCFNGFITKIRMVSKYSNETYIDVYVGGGSAGEAEISITFNGTGWDIYNDITTANITDGYTIHEIEL